MLAIRFHSNTLNRSLHSAQAQSVCPCAERKNNRRGEETEKTYRDLLKESDRGGYRIMNPAPTDPRTPLLGNNGVIWPTPLVSVAS